MSAFGGKTDSQKGGLLRLLLTLSGHSSLVIKKAEQINFASGKETNVRSLFPLFLWNKLVGAGIQSFLDVDRAARESKLATGVRYNFLYF